jgi:ribonuclease T1
MLKAAAAKVYQTGLALMLGAAFALASPAALARKAPEVGATVPGFETVSLAELPREGRTTYGRILQGGPFSSDKDGTVFGNRERILPRQARGYYREYTVRTPGAKTGVRGASSAAACSPRCPMPASTRATTTTAFSRSSNEFKDALQARHTAAFDS